MWQISADTTNKESECSASKEKKGVVLEGWGLGVLKQSLNVYMY